jgi:hypothetical protein
VATLPERDHTDPATPGLQPRVRAKRGTCSRTWLLRYRWGEEYVRIVIGHAPATSLAEARERALELRKAIDNGIDPRRARPRRRAAPAPLPLSSGALTRGSTHTIEYLASEFMERYVRPHRKRPGYAQAILDADVIPEWRGRDARTIEPAEVITLLDKIVDRGSSSHATSATTPLQLLYPQLARRAVRAARRAVRDQTAPRSRAGHGAGDREYSGPTPGSQE